jgi:hypothetical protein
VFGRSKTKTSDDLTFRSVAGVVGLLKSLYERLQGRKSEDVYRCEGTAVHLEGALMREHGSNHFGLYVRLGESVVPTSINFLVADPVLDSLPIERFGPSPQEQRRKDKEAERARLTPLERKQEIEAMYEGWGLRVIHPGDHQPGIAIGSRTRNAPDIKIL